MITVVTVCPLCGIMNEIQVNENDYFDWERGKHTQDAFPYLTPYERESLISGFCPDCWERMFPIEDDN